MGVAGWKGGTTDLCPGRQEPSRRHWVSGAPASNYDRQSQCSESDLWKYVTQFSATPSWTVPIISMSCRLVSSSLTMLYWPRKCDDTAISASFGQRLNQSIVQPEIRPGNFNDRLRNFSPTCRRKVTVSSTVSVRPFKRPFSR